MNYQALSDYPLSWVYNRADMAISDDDKATIKPLVRQYANQVWQREVSAEAIDLERLEANEWLANKANWHGSVNWETAFDSDELQLPAELADYLNWDPNTIVYVCYDADHIIETRYGAFRRSWKAFLFAAEQALIVGRRRNEVLWFVDESKVKLGNKA
ncbi:DUF2947 family protein [Ferrimonas senticii]|uniref:DUF2947 family protein n=1 Tax=Ferrimonas senticii TaxID=394566 RepID=UPI00040E9C43|nr:DUF2947 family protein [Ferrimonas senticii]